MGTREAWPAERGGQASGASHPERDPPDVWAELEPVLSRALEARSLHELLTPALTDVLHLVGGETAAILLRDGNELSVVAGVGPEGELEAGSPVRVGEGFAGRIAASGQPQLLLAGANDALLRHEGLRRYGVRSVFGVPLPAAGAVIGVAVVGSSEPYDFSEHDKRLLELLGRHLAPRIQVHVLAESARRDSGAHQRARTAEQFLAQASERLFASIEHADTLDAVGRLPVPELADGCIVACAGADGELAPARAVHAAVGVERRLWAAVRDAPELLRGVMGAAAAARAPGQVAVGSLERSVLEPLSSSEAVRTVAPELEGCWSASVSLVARGALVGTMTLLGRRPPLVAEQLSMLVELGRRAALALDNARLYCDARQAARLRDEVLSVVSHDLRGPLSSIRIGAGALSRDPSERVDSGMLRRTSEIIERSAARMQRLIDDLVDIAALRGGSLSLSLGAHDPVALAQEAVEDVRHRAESRGIAVMLEAYDLPPLIRADRDRLLQVVDNLLENAVEATPRGGSLTLSVQERGQEVLFAIEDTGRGIPPEDMPHLFERYRRGRNSSYRGTGLGLTIAKALVEAHHGRIWAASKVGVGTTFFFTLPRAPE